METIIHVEVVKNTELKFIITVTEGDDIQKVIEKELENMCKDYPHDYKSGEYTIVSMQILEIRQTKKGKQVTCIGCIDDIANQQGHMGPGGCMASSSGGSQPSPSLSFGS